MKTTLTLLATLLATLILLPSCSNLPRLGLPPTLKQQLLDLYKNAPLVLETEINGKPVRVVIREKKDGTMEEIAVTPEGYQVDRDDVIREVAK